MYYQPEMTCSSWVPGFHILNADITYNWKLGKLQGELSFYAKNIFNEHYYGFTEPNNWQDYNSYQPAPGREFFGSLKLKI
jgi:outer membrane receptor protein involved in Fe transport